MARRSLTPLQPTSGGSLGRAQVAGLIGVSHRLDTALLDRCMLNRPLLFASDVKHSQAEARYFSLGRTDGGRHLAIVFTTRGTRVRVISARPMSRAERRVYGKVIAHAQSGS